MGGDLLRDDLLREIEQFLYREARLLDDRRFHEWLELFTDDVRYWMVGRVNRYPRASKAIAGSTNDRRDDSDLEDQLALLDETKVTLEGRVARLDTGMAWGEDPPSRTRHMITNVEVEAGDTPAELKVYSNFLVYRTRAETEQDLYVGARQDVLRRVGGSWKIAHRKAVLDQNVLLPKNVSVFF
jgi:3-phenylpropionate/cinnamic acid dioxygenase small subunit